MEILFSSFSFIVFPINIKEHTGGHDAYSMLEYFLQCCPEECTKKTPSKSKFIAYQTRNTGHYGKKRKNGNFKIGSYFFLYIELL